MTIPRIARNMRRFSRPSFQCLSHGHDLISRIGFVARHFHTLRSLYSSPSSSITSIRAASARSLIFSNYTTSVPATKPDPSKTVLGIVDEISGLTLLEVSDLVEIMRKKMGIDEMPVMAMMMPGMGFSPAGGMRGKGPGASAQAEEKVEKTVFDLKLEAGFDAGAKIKIIKEVRSFTNLGLKEAKELVEKAPAVLRKGVSKDEAEKIIETMKGLGAKIIME